MYAVIKTGGKQYKVTEGDVLKVEKSETDGESIFEIIEDIITMLNTRAPTAVITLENLLLELRIIKEDYTENKFSLLEQLAYKITNEDDNMVCPSTNSSATSLVSTEDLSSILVISASIP